MRAAAGHRRPHLVVTLQFGLHRPASETHVDDRKPAEHRQCFRDMTVRPADHQRVKSDAENESQTGGQRRRADSPISSLPNRSDAGGTVGADAGRPPDMGNLGS